MFSIVNRCNIKLKIDIHTVTSLMLNQYSPISYKEIVDAAFEITEPGPGYFSSCTGMKSTLECLLEGFRIGIYNNQSVALHRKLIENLKSSHPSSTFLKVIVNPMKSMVNMTECEIIYSGPRVIIDGSLYHDTTIVSNQELEILPKRILLTLANKKPIIVATRWGQLAFGCSDGVISVDYFNKATVTMCDISNECFEKVNAYLYGDRSIDLSNCAEIIGLVVAVKNARKVD